MTRASTVIAARWSEAVVARLRDGPSAVTIGFADGGLVRLEYATADGLRIRQLCTFEWLVERLFSPRPG